MLFSSPEFNFSATLVNNQLACLLPVGILTLVMFILNIYLPLFVYIDPEKPQMKSGQLRIHFTHTFCTYVWTYEFEHLGKRGSALGKWYLRVKCPMGKLELKYFSSPASYLPKDTSLSTVSTPVPRMLSKDCPASEYNKSRTKVSCNTAGVLQDKKAW